MIYQALWGNFVSVVVSVTTELEMLLGSYKTFSLYLCEFLTKSEGDALMFIKINSAISELLNVIRNANAS